MPLRRVLTLVAAAHDFAAHTAFESLFRILAGKLRPNPLRAC